MLWAGSAAGDPPPDPLPEADQWWYFVDAATETTIKQAGATTGWDVTTIGAIERSLDLSADFSEIAWIWISPDGTKMIVAGRNTTPISVWRKYTLSQAWDVSTATYAASQFSTGGNSGIAGWIDADGERIYTTISTAGSVCEIRQYALSAAWDVSTATFVGSLDLINLLGYDIGRAGVYLSDDGSDFSFIGVDELWDPGPPVVRSAHIFCGVNSTPFDITTGLTYTDWYLEDRSAPAPLEGAVPALAFEPSGEAFVILVGGDALRHYSGSIPWDMSISSYPNETVPAAKDLSAAFPSGIVNFFAGPSA